LHEKAVEVRQTAGQVERVRRLRGIQGRTGDFHYQGELCTCLSECSRRLHSPE